MHLYYSLALLFILTSSVRSYSTGPPNDEKTCKTLLPDHFAEKQTSEPPYTITPSKLNVKSNEAIDLTLTGKTKDDSFRGFMIQVRQNDRPVGKFVVKSTSDPVQLLICEKDGDTATHKKNSGINSVSFKWIAPENLHGPVSVVGTLVKRRDTFWVANTYAQLTID